MKRFKRLCASFLAGIALIAGVGATAAPAVADTAGLTGWSNGDDLDTRRWYDNGVMARSKEFYDPGSAAWYWADADGSIAHDKDVYQPSSGGKWVRYDHDGHMIKGEDYRYGGWYYFDQTTGAMAKGVRYVSSNGGKWVYYDWTTGKMAHGEAYLSYDREHTGWYYFDQITGAMFKGVRYVPSNGGKWVYYDWTTGKMAHGEAYLSYDAEHTGWYCFDQTTGAMIKGWRTLADGRRVYYDDVSGKMVKGWRTIGDTDHYFNQSTGNLEQSRPHSSTPTVGQTVWWVNNGSSRKYHTHQNCPSLQHATHSISSGSLADAQSHGHDELCSNCANMG